MAFESHPLLLLWLFMLIVCLGNMIAEDLKG